MIINICMTSSISDGIGSFLNYHGDQSAGKYLHNHLLKARCVKLLCIQRCHTNISFLFLWFLFWSFFMNKSLKWFSILWFNYVLLQCTLKIFLFAQKWCIPNYLFAFSDILESPFFLNPYITQSFAKGLLLLCIESIVHHNFRITYCLEEKNRLDL